MTILPTPLLPGLFFYVPQQTRTTYLTIFSFYNIIHIAAAQLGTRPEKLKIQKWYTIYKDHITLEDYEIHDGMGLELYV